MPNKFQSINQSITFLLSFDFSKAFDTLLHRCLLTKLRKIGCSDHVVRWFGSYLSGRLQAVKKDDGTTSQWLPLATGVPQGSVLGPLLFTIFINDLPYHLRHSSHMIYADDIQIYQHSSSDPEALSKVISRLNEDATAVVRWSLDNGLKLNPSETTNIVLGSAAYIGKLNRSSLPKIFVDGIAIPYADNITSLGVTISPTLNWDLHITKLSARVYAALHSLRHYKHALSRSLRKELVESLIFPHFDYGCAVYHDLTVKQNERLHRHLNACIRYVYGFIPWMAHVTPYRIALGWLSVKRRRELFIGTLRFKTLKFSSPSYLTSHFTPLHSRPEIRRSHRTFQGHLLPHVARTEALAQSFSFTATRLLNSIGSLDIEATSSASFKAALRLILMNKDKSDWIQRARIENLVTVPPQLSEVLRLPPLHPQ